MDNQKPQTKKDGNKKQVFNKLVKNRCLGRFEISRETIDCASADQVQQLFGHFIIIRAGYMAYSDRIQYDAYSSLFNPVPYGEMMPEYNITIIQEPDDSWVVETNRKS